MIIKITYSESPLLVEAEIDGDRDDIADSADFFMTRIAAMKKALIKEAISADKSEEKLSAGEKLDKALEKAKEG